MKTQIDNTLTFLASRIVHVKFDPKGNSRLEYARLRNTLLLGKGESACMVHCRDNKDVLGSSNLRDIRDYCGRARHTARAHVCKCAEIADGGRSTPITPDQLTD